MLINKRNVTIDKETLEGVIKEISTRENLLIDATGLKAIVVKGNVTANKLKVIGQAYVEGDAYVNNIKVVGASRLTYGGGANTIPFIKLVYIGK
jgi:cytoskeletal protein CcmA (bactofilin family)